MAQATKDCAVMAQANFNQRMSLGHSEGSTNTCQQCGCQLVVQSGTDPDLSEKIGGFKEEYECVGCGNTGTYKFREKDGRETFTGVCANYDH